MISFATLSFWVVKSRRGSYGPVYPVKRCSFFCMLQGHRTQCVPYKGENNEWRQRLKSLTSLHPHQAPVWEHPCRMSPLSCGCRQRYQLAWRSPSGNQSNLVQLHHQLWGREGKKVRGLCYGHLSPPLPPPPPPFSLCLLSLARTPANTTVRHKQQHIQLWLNHILETDSSNMSGENQFI